MYLPRKIESHPSWSDADGIKIYTISSQNLPVAQSPYLAQLAKVKARKFVEWTSTPAFVIFHDGADVAYLVLAWWGSDNELFTSVSAQIESGWVEDPAKYSFCIYDLEIIWQERNYFIESMCGAKPDIERYREKRLDGTQNFST